jgi:hypothetical protein
MVALPRIRAPFLVGARRLAGCVVAALAWALATPAQPQAAPLSDTGAPASAEDSPPPGRLQLVSIGSAEGDIHFELLVPVAGRPPYPVVLVLPDEIGAGRSSPYADALLNAGIVVLERVADDEGAMPPALHRVVAAVEFLIAADPRLDPGRVGLLGFGAGGRLALGLAPGRFAARALLYPGCSALALPVGDAAGGPLLLLHGGRDAANPEGACTAAATRLSQGGREVRRIRYAEAGYAWDHPGYGLEQRILLPRPDQPGLVAALPWPALAAMSAAQVAGFLGTALASAGR